VSTAESLTETAVEPNYTIIHTTQCLVHQTPCHVFLDCREDSALRQSIGVQLRQFKCDGQETDTHRGSQTVVRLLHRRFCGICEESSAVPDLCADVAPCLSLCAVLHNTVTLIVLFRTIFDRTICG
jgi:hypothetical protein